MERDRLADLARFAHWHLASGDVDPVYPVLADLYADRSLFPTDADAVAFTFLYVAYYNLPSALEVWTSQRWRPGSEIDDEAVRWPTGTERRAHRSPAKFVDHLACLSALFAVSGGADRFVTDDLPADPAVAWLVAQDRLRAIHGNGRWAAYKTGEILATVHGLRLAPTDAGHEFSSGPRKGLGTLFPEALVAGQDPETVGRLNVITERLRADLAERGEPMPVEQLETVLCDWNSMLGGHYYVGHDIDQLQEQIDRHPAIGSDGRRRLYEARERSFDARWLGEASGWTGVRRDLNTAYRDRGVIEWWGE